MEVSVLPVCLGGVQVSELTCAGERVSRWDAAGRRRARLPSSECPAGGDQSSEFSSLEHLSTAAGPGSPDRDIMEEVRGQQKLHVWYT